MEALQVIPKNVQVRYRGSFFPPNYNLVINEVAAGLAGKLAETFGLKSSNIIFNQNAMSSQYLSFRYILPKQPVRYFDALIGVDQAEILFQNPANILELQEECLKVWEGIIEKTKSGITEHYFDAAFHSTTEGIKAQEFLKKFVSIKADRTDVQGGFSLTVKMPQIEGEARIALEASTSIPDGLYVTFSCVSKKRVDHVKALKELFDVTIKVYRDVQALAQIQVLEAT